MTQEQLLLSVTSPYTPPSTNSPVSQSTLGLWRSQGVTALCRYWGGGPPHCIVLFQNISKVQTCIVLYYYQILVNCSVKYRPCIVLLGL